MTGWKGLEDMLDDPKKPLPMFIVGEVSKNWERDGDPFYVRDEKLLSQLFEELINSSLERGYVLHSFDVSRVIDTTDDVMNETIIAVFKRA